MNYSEVWRKNWNPASSRIKSVEPFRPSFVLGCVKRKNPLLLSEFSVAVYEDRIDWDGLDKFLWLLLHKKDGADFRAAVRRFWRMMR